MARRAKRASPTGLTGPTEPVGIKSANEPWTTCILEDGTTLEIRPVIVAVRRSRNRFNDDGSPIYEVKSAILTNATSPKKLYKKAAKKHVKKRSAKKK